MPEKSKTRLFNGLSPDCNRDDYLGKKEGQTSNQFKEDLSQIIDFLDENRREIEQISEFEKLE